MNSKLILAFDPSGAYYESKGTTGWCVYNAEMNTITLVGFISAIKYDSPLKYWDAHLKIINKYSERYKDRLHIVIEDYRLYANSANAQINSTMETCKLIGILQYYCLANDIKYTMQMASQVKNRWTDDILIHKGILRRKSNTLYLSDGKTKVNKHVRDSIRHAIHYATFKNN